MRKEEVYSGAKRLLAAFMTAAMAVSMASPLAYAAESTQTTTQTANPVVVDQPTNPAADAAADSAADAEPTLDTDLTYNSAYANTAPAGMDYTGTLSGMDMNVYKKELTYADLGFSSAAEMEAAFAEANEETEAESDAAHDRNMAWLKNMLTDDDLAPMREEAE